MIYRALASAVAGFGTALALAAPAWAHGGEAPDGTNYRTEITRVDGSLPGVTIRVIEAGARLELVNRGDHTVEVLGYQGEPYLEIRPDGVYENVNSPATYLNVTARGGEVPAGADPTAAPSWRQAVDKPRARWHDHRTHWMSATPPPRVAADPGREHLIRDWVVPLRTGVTSTVGVHGTLRWVPPPAAGAWWAAALAGAVTIGAVGLLPPTSRAAPGGGPGPTSTPGSPAPTAPDGGPGPTSMVPTAPARRLLAVLAVVGGSTAIGYAVARELDAGSTGGGVPLGLLAGQVWPVLAGAGCVAAGCYALARRPSADFALALAGACLALFAGVTNASVLGRGVAPVPFAAVLARLAVTSLIAIGAGLVVAGSLRLRAAAGRTSGGAGGRGAGGRGADGGGVTPAA